MSWAGAARYPAHCLLASLCVGIAAANVARSAWFVPAGCAAACAAAAAGSEGQFRLLFAALALVASGWSWGVLRLDRLDRSVLTSQVGRAERSLVVATAPARRTKFALRIPAELRSFGSRIGLAFQLLDDVLDVTGPAERTGKARGTDLLDGTVTLPLILASDRDPGLRTANLRGLDPAGAEQLCERIAASGALEEVRSQALAMVAEAKAGIGGSAFDAEQRDLLGLVADGVVERYS